MAEDKKIIVDEDWKTQVERERTGDEKSPEPKTEASDKPAPDMPIPPADLSYLIMMLSMEAMGLMGLMPGKVEKNLPVAKHLIDLLDVLQQKTEGNRTAEESDALEGSLHQLRMAFVQVAG